MNRNLVRLTAEALLLGASAMSAFAGTVAVSWKTFQEERWKTDEAAIKAVVEAAGHTYISTDAQGSAQKQAADIEGLIGCSVIFMLPGWSNSKGARIEHMIARWLSMDIMYSSKAEVDPEPKSAQQETEDVSELRVLLEQKTTGVDPKGDAGCKKAPLWLLPPKALEEASWVHKLGADKYGPWNWRKTRVKASTYISAIMRHLTLGWAKGEDIDTESGRSHLAHIVANCNILMDAQDHHCLDDDRAK